MTSDSSLPLTMIVPDFPFSYDRWLSHPEGLGSVPSDRIGAEVAVVGGGMAGMTAAYELMRLGLRPVVYEAGQLGGRMRSVPFPKHPRHIAEMGAMRFPLSARSLFHYVGLLGLTSRPFPNPLAPQTPSTVIDLNGSQVSTRGEDELPEVYREVADAWAKSLQERTELSLMRSAIRERDVCTLKSVWNRIVREFDDVSFYGFLAGSPAFRSFRHREIFGQVGFGTGGWDTDFPNSVLEVLRVVFTGADTDQVLLEGGAQQVPCGLWTHAPAAAARWPAGTTLASLHEDGPRPAVTALRRRGDNIQVEDKSGEARDYPAVVFTPHVWTLLSRIECDSSLLTTPQWLAVERTHYMGSSKLFVLTDRPFWRDTDPRTGRDTMGMTLTDRMPRGGASMSFVKAGLLILRVLVLFRLRG
ncbi:flavin monoamine oxidase family protein [Streptomyces sp. NPDC060022]|uniref:flavin monoamine oxidase family protein n=1 Tax=Streptomyces sp. NPDC060022 TaxID=3347039 RepID=UPI0036B84AE8